MIGEVEGEWRAGLEQEGGNQKVGRGSNSYVGSKTFSPGNKEQSLAVPVYSGHMA